MDKFRRALALLISFIMLVSLAITAYAVPTGDVDIPAVDIFDEEIPEGLQYTVTGAAATVTGYTGSLTELTLPQSVDGVPLTAIAPDAFRDTQLVSVSIPDCVTQIGAGALAATTMTAVWVDENNPYYSSDSRGVLYNKHQTVLVQLPGTYEGVFFLPETVTSIQSGALAGCEKVTAIFSSNANVSVAPQDGISGIGLHFGIQAGLCEDGCLYCQGCDGWLTAEGAVAANHYRVTFLDQHGVQLSSRLLHEGEPVQAPQLPEKYEDRTYRYGFVGWDREITSATADAVYTAAYETLGLTGDFNDDGVVSQRDAIYLLRCCLEMPGFTPNHSGDMNDDGILSDDDVAYLLRFTLFPNRYPLHPKL